MVKLQMILQKEKGLGRECHIGKNIRNLLKKNGGTMPDEMERPNKSLKELEHKNILK